MLYLDLNSAVFCFCFFLAEVHRPLHGCDDPALCHHTTPWQQWPLLSVRCCPWSTAQCMVSAELILVCLMLCNEVHVWKCTAVRFAWLNLKFSYWRQVREDGKDKNSVVSFTLTDEPQHIDLVTSNSKEEVMHYFSCMLNYLQSVFNRVKDNNLKQSRRLYVDNFLLN